MKKFAALLVTLLFAVTLVAQTKPTPSVPKMTRWQITPTVSVQYDPTVWKLGAIESDDHRKQPVLFLMAADKSIRANVALSVMIITADDMAAADIIASRIAATQDRKDVETLALKEYQAGEEYGVLFAFTAQNDKGDPFVIGRWSFAGDKLDTKSHIVIEFEGVIAMALANDDVMEKMDAVIQTYEIKTCMLPEGCK
jgi:hypothetical protein